MMPKLQLMIMRKPVRSTHGKHNHRVVRQKVVDFTTVKKRLN